MDGSFGMQTPFYHINVIGHFLILFSSFFFSRDNYGGALAKVAPNATAFPHRRAIFQVVQ
jgi:hypothetical protein